MEKKTARAYGTAGTALLLAALFSFGFPALLFRWQDKEREGQIGQEQAARVVITDQPELTIMEKIRLAGRESSYSMMLEKGKNYSQETIGDKAGQELEELKERGILNETDTEVAACDMSARFIMDVEGENSLILWEGQVYTESGMQFTLLMDDETGKILSLYCFEGIYLDSGGGGQLAYSWGEYLGCHVASVSETEISENSTLDGKAAKEFEKEVQMQIEGGIPEAEARAAVSRDWGLSESGFSVRACYGDESGWEAVYRLEYIPFSGASLSIIPE